MMVIVMIVVMIMITVIIRIVMMMNKGKWSLLVNLEISSNSINKEEKV